MATTPVNRKYRVIEDVLDFQVATGTTFNEGDLMYWDSSTNTAKPLDSISAATYLLGDSQGTQPVTHTSSKAFSGSVSIYVGRHTVKLVCKETGTFYFNTPAYYHTDAQGFTTVSGSGAVQIGVMQGSPKERGVGSGTTAIGSEYEIILRKSYAFNV